MPVMIHSSYPAVSGLLFTPPVFLFALECRWNPFSYIQRIWCSSLETLHDLLPLPDTRGCW